MMTSKTFTHPFNLSGDLDEPRAESPSPEKKSKSVSFERVDSDFSVDTDFNIDRSVSLGSTDTYSLATENVSPKKGVLKSPTKQSDPPEIISKPPKDTNIEQLFSQINMSDNTETKKGADFVTTLYPYSINKWKDEEMNRKLCVQIHLRSGTLASKFNPKLEMHGPKQYLCLYDLF